VELEVISESCLAATTSPQPARKNFDLKQTGCTNFGRQATTRFWL